MLKNIYGFDRLGRKVPVGSYDDGSKAVGGRIFYIDSNSDEVVEFYDAQGNPLPNVAVGDTPAYYKVTSAGVSGKEKYYIYYDELINGNRWTYYVDGSPHLEEVGISNGIGAGKIGTNLMFNADDGAYVTNDSDGYPTIWYTIKQMRDNKINDCDDWFIPTKDELEELRKAIGFVVITTSESPVVVPAGPVTGGVIAGIADNQPHYVDAQGNRTCYPSNTKFLNFAIKACSEYSYKFIDLWFSFFQRWNATTKEDVGSYIAIRSF